MKYSADTDRDGWVTINYEEFMKVSLWSILLDDVSRAVW
jgi:hypothetical protein